MDSNLTIGTLTSSQEKILIIVVQSGKVGEGRMGRGKPDGQ